jgi:uncharacterized protein YllA (UPF0747 family)
MLDITRSIYKRLPLLVFLVLVTLFLGFSHLTAFRAGFEMGRDKLALDSQAIVKRLDSMEYSSNQEASLTKEIHQEASGTKETLSQISKQLNNFNSWFEYLNQKLDKRVAQ